MGPWLAVATLIALGLALKSTFNSHALRAGLDAITDRVRTLDERMRRLDERFQRLQAPPEAAEISTPPVLPEEPIVAHLAESPTASPEPMTAAPEPPPQPAAGSGKSLEHLLAENWLVWLGGLTLALGGAFLVKLSIDHGLLTPTIRVVLGVLLGIGLAVSADWVARRERTAQPEQTDLSYVPPALAAAGAATVFASLYAAYQLYDLLPSILAFPLLAATAGATVIMSLRHGPFVAALGLFGAYLVPLLVESETPQALPLFAYLAFVTAGSLALLRHRTWWWLAWLSLVGAIFWVLAWLAASGNHPETPVVGGFLLVQLALFGAFRRGIDRVAFLAGIGEAPMILIVTRSAFWAVAAAMVVLVHVDGSGETSLAAAFLAALFFLWFGYRDHALDDVIAVAGALLLAVLASWNLPLPSSKAELLAYARQPVEVVNFSTAAVLGALLLGGGSFGVLRQVPRPGRWAALSAVSPALILVIAYWRLRNFALDIGWSSAALALAGLELAAAASVARLRTGETQIEIALAAYTVGVLGTTILAATFALSNAWLTVALALHLPAMGWVEGRIRLPVLRRLALGVAGIVLVRLALNPYLLAYPLTATSIFNWLLYGYGVPALAFIAATRQFGSRADDLLVSVLEGGSIVFTAMLLTLELRHALYGRLDAPLSDLGRDAVQTLLWLGLAGFLLWVGERRQRPVLTWGGIALFGLGTVQAVIWQAIIANPLLTDDSVGRLVIFDVVTLAYGLPALLYAGIVWLRLGPIALRWAARISAAGFALLWLTLEIRHAFQGEILTWGEIGEAEWYAYSAAWLAFAGAGLTAGLIWRDGWLRRVSLAGVGVVVAKVFVFVWPRSAACCGRSPSSVSAEHWSGLATPIASCGH